MASLGVLPKLLLAFTFQAAVALNWSSSQIQDGSTVRACLHEKTSFPWDYELSQDEQVINVEWYRMNGPKQGLLAVFAQGQIFAPSLTHGSKVTYIPGAGIEISRVNWTDFGTYRVKVNYLSNGNFMSSEQTAYLAMEDAPVLAGGHLVAQVSPQPVLDSITGLLHVQLTCGHFLTLDNGDLEVVWKTPSGQTLSSTSYAHGNFNLNLPHPAEGGGYICRLKDPFVVTKCMSGVSYLMRGAYVHVNEVQIRLLMLEGKVQHLQNVSENLQADWQADLGLNLEAQLKNMTSQVDRLAEISQALIAHTEKLAADNENLKTQTSKLMSDNDDLKGETQELRSENENLKSQIQQVTSKIGSESSRVDGLTAETSRLSAETKNLSSRIGAALCKGYSNMALRKYAKQSSTLSNPEDTQNGRYPGVASLAVDGNTDGNYLHGSCTHTDYGDNNPWFYVDLGDTYYVQAVVIKNREDCCGERLADFTVEVFQEMPESASSAAQVCYRYAGAMPGGATERLDCDCLLTGRYVRIRKRTAFLTLCEVQVLGRKAGSSRQNEMPVRRLNLLPKFTQDTVV